jgi:hypothetical protein
MMKHGGGVKDREDKSSCTEILIAEDFVKINHSEPLRLVEESTRRETKLNRFLRLFIRQDRCFTVSE